MVQPWPPSAAPWRCCCGYAKLCTTMRITYKGFLAVLGCALCALQLPAQQKVAEGEYQTFQSGAPVPDRGTRHWTLMASSAGYLLQSEIENSDWGLRVVQIEELTSEFVPTSIGFDLFLQKHAKPNVSLKCTFSGDSIVCNGKSEKGPATPSDPYHYQGAVLFSVSELQQFDLPWLMAAAINMAHLTKGQAPVRTVRIFGGAALELTDDINVAALQSVKQPNQKLEIVRPEQYVPWEFISDEGDKEQLEFYGKEDVPLNGTTVAARHFVIKSGDEALNFWMAEPGLLVKIAGTEMEYRLVNYKQYQKLIPGVKVEAQPPAQPVKAK